MAHKVITTKEACALSDFSASLAKMNPGACIPVSGAEHIFLVWREIHGRPVWRVLSQFPEPIADALGCDIRSVVSPALEVRA